MRVATFNILHGRSLVDGRVDVDRFAAAISTLDADVVSLQEVDRGQTRSLGADLTAIAADAIGAVGFRFAAAMVGAPGSQWVAATGTEPVGVPSYGVALLSRWPVRSWQVARLPAMPGRTPYIWPGRRRPSLVRDEARVALVAEVAAPRGSLTVVGTHLSFLAGWNVVQLRRLMAGLRAVEGPMLLMGDLNMDEPSAVRATRMQPLASAPTFPAPAPQRQIDHVLGRRFRARSAGRAIELPLSDHRALVADLIPADDRSRR